MYAAMGGVSVDVGGGGVEYSGLSEEMDTDGGGGEK